MQLRPYQQKLADDVAAQWGAGLKNVGMDLATGGGKTATATKILAERDAPTCAIAHRQELVSQISVAMAKWGVEHRIIAPPAVVKLCSDMHREEVGRSYHKPGAWCAVGGVVTINQRAKDLSEWGRQVAVWAQDEAHHVLKENQWGKATKVFPNALGLGMSATWIRSDGKGLGRHHDGLFDCIVQGPTMADLIASGSLTEYRIFCPPSDFDASAVPLGTTGDYNQVQLRKAARKSHIVGDVVEQYLRIACGKLGVVFVVDVDSAMATAQAFRDAGVPAEAVSAKTPDRVRNELIRRFRNRDIEVLVNVDLFGEGFDLPAIEVVSMARPTQSYSLYAQQFGRALRPLAGKQFGIIIDHVGNVVRHGLPDAPRVWSLDRRDKRGSGTRDPNALPITVCTNPACGLAYEKLGPSCPYCGFRPEPVGRSLPEQVDGDLLELTPEALAQLRGQVAQSQALPGQVAEAYLKSGAGPKIAAIQQANQRKKLDAQQELRDAIALWAGCQRAAGKSDSESYRRFYHTFQVDVLTAQTLGRADAEKLAAKVRELTGV